MASVEKKWKERMPPVTGAIIWRGNWLMGASFITVFSGECEICTLMFDQERFIVSLTCGHILCATCQTETSGKLNSSWRVQTRIIILFQGTCPFCRQTYESSEIRRLYLSTHNIDCLPVEQRDYIEMRQKLNQLKADRFRLESANRAKEEQIEQLTMRLESIDNHDVKMMPFVRLIQTDKNLLNQIFF